jgi:hypothetical protein
VPLELINGSYSNNVKIKEQKLEGKKQAAALQQNPFIASVVRNDSTYHVGKTHQLIAIGNGTFDRRMK